MSRLCFFCVKWRGGGLGVRAPGHSYVFRRFNWLDTMHWSIRLLHTGHQGGGPRAGVCPNPGPATTTAVGVSLCPNGMSVCPVIKSSTLLT
jgi:hypothetical protein